MVAKKIEMKSHHVFPLSQSWRTLELKFRRFRIVVLRLLLQNQTSKPYLSGDAFATLVDYSPYGPNGGKIPNEHSIAIAKSLFVPSHLLKSFVLQFGGITHAQVLITGNSDENFDELPTLPSSIRLWLGQNLAVSEQSESLKIQTIPIGLENLALGRAGRKKYLRLNSALIRDRILVPPMALSNPVRSEVLELLSKSPGIYDVYLNYLDERKYFKLASKYKFVLCLEGNGYENHRIWETLYRNSFPVMLKTSWSETLKDLGIPILFLDSILDAKPLTLHDFLQTHNNFESKEVPTLWTPHWESLIAKWTGG